MAGSMFGGCDDPHRQALRLPHLRRVLRAWGVPVEAAGEAYTQTNEDDMSEFTRNARHILNQTDTSKYECRDFWPLKPCDVMIAHLRAAIDEADRMEDALRKIWRASRVTEEGEGIGVEYAAGTCDVIREIAADALVAVVRVGPTAPPKTETKPTRGER